MPDISKCRGGTCPLRDRCYRFTSKPSEFWQSWFNGVPYGKVEANDCRYFMPDLVREDGVVNLRTEG